MVCEGGAPPSIPPGPGPRQALARSWSAPRRARAGPAPVDRAGTPGGTKRVPGAFFHVGSAAEESLSALALRPHKESGGMIRSSATASPGSPGACAPAGVGAAAGHVRGRNGPAAATAFPPLSAGRAAGWGAAARGPRRPSGVHGVGASRPSDAGRRKGGPGGQQRPSVRWP